mgnify:FL=1
MTSSRKKGDLVSLDDVDFSHCEVESEFSGFDTAFKTKPVAAKGKDANLATQSLLKKDVRKCWIWNFLRFAPNNILFAVDVG